MKNTSKSITSGLISNLDQITKDRILQTLISKASLSKFREREKQDNVRALIDLRDIHSKSESEVYDILNTMVKNSQYFMYCGPLLLNINPGPNQVKDYLNLQSWIKETEDKDEKSWKPHLYTFMYYVYQNLIKEKKDQVVNMLGQIGSGKTFNMIHIIEYFCCMVGPSNHQIDTFDMIHKSIQLVHILGSIFRQNNLESTSCGILLRLGFGEENKICNFDIVAKILDFTLPFSENGRSFSILHSFLAAASADLKRNFFLPENEVHLNFFRKFSKNFSKKTKERFKLNDFEIWNKFHSLMKFFGFEKEEVIEFLQILSFLININELGMTKGEMGKSKGYIISKGQCSRKLASLLSMDEDQFITQMGVFKDVNEIKNTLISLMKYSYYTAFEYIMTRIRKKLKLFFYDVLTGRIDKKETNNISAINDKQTTNNNFSQQSSSKGKNMHSVKGSATSIRSQSHRSNRSVTKTNKSESLEKISLPGEKNIRYINFLDFPGEVEDQTLGGLVTNLANECINLFAGNSYSFVVEKLCKEKVNLKLFKPLHSYSVVEAMMGSQGLFSFLSNPFTEENYNKLKQATKKKSGFKNCLKFVESSSRTAANDFKFDVNFSHTTVRYNYETLYLESKSISNSAKALKVFNLVNNRIIKSMYQKIIPQKDDIFTYIHKILDVLFKPIEGLNPYVIYCLHSNYSLKLFFGSEKNAEKSEAGWVIPRKLTQNLLKKSICIPVLYWEWFGYHEWIEVDAFVNEFADDFERIERKLKEKEKKRAEKLSKSIIPSSLKRTSSSKSKVSEDKSKDEEDDVDFRKLKPYEKANYILNMFMLSRDTVIGKNMVMCKSGTLLKLRNKLDKLAEAENIRPEYTATNNPTTSSGVASKKSQISKRGRPIPPGARYTQNIYKKTRSDGNSSKGTFVNKSQLVSLLENYGTLGSDVGGLTSKNFPNLKKTSLKTQCQLIILSAKDKDPVNLADKQPKKLLRSASEKLELFNIDDESISTKYNIFNVMEKTKSKNLDYVASDEDAKDKEQTLDDTEENELKKFRKKNNIIIPNKGNFELVNSLFNFNKDTNFNVFDYSNVIPEIIMIQCAYRQFKAKQKRLLLKYVMTQIIKIQSAFRGLLTRQKFARLKRCLELILRIQRNWRERFEKVTKDVVKIQCAFRRFFIIKKAERKLERLRKCEENDDEYFDSSDEEMKKSSLNKKSKKTNKQKKLQQFKRKRKSTVTDYTKPIKSLEYKLGRRLSPKKAAEIPQKKKEDIKYDLNHEKNPQKIINALLFDPHLMTDTEKVNRLLANQSGVKKETRYKLLQIDQPGTVPLNQILPKNNRTTLTQIDENVPKKRKIEDKLLEYGKALKQKHAQDRVDKLKSEEEKYTFAPKIGNNYYNKNLNVNDFYLRAAQFDERKETNLEKIKTTIVDPELNELTFKPKLSKMSYKLKRSVEDLYNWKESRQKKLEEKQLEKKNKEEEEIQKIRNMTHMNEKSKQLLTKKNAKEAAERSRTSQNQSDEYFKEFSADGAKDEVSWPDLIVRKYFNDDKDNYDKKARFNHLDYLNNKPQIQYDEKDEDDEEDEEDEY